MSPKSNENVLKRDRKGYIETQRSDVIMRADTGVVCTQAKKYQGRPAASTTWGQSWQSWSLEPPEGIPTHTLISDSWLPNCETINFYGFKPPSLR